MTKAPTLDPEPGEGPMILAFCAFEDILHDEHEQMTQWLVPYYRKCVRGEMTNAQFARYALPRMTKCIRRLNKALADAKDTSRGIPD